MGKKMMNGRSPSFFKVLIGDFTTKLSMPPAFLKNFNGNLPKISILKSITEKLWRVIMERNDEGFFFSHGWSEFVKDHGLEDGDFLLFWFIGNSTFEVMIYGRTACVKDSIGSACKGRTVRSNRFNKSQVSRNVSGASLKRTRNCHKIKIESKQKQMAEALDFDMKPNHPYFVKVLQYYHRYTLIIPIGFARETGLINKKSTVLKDSQGSVWPVDIVKHSHIDFSTGWSNFFVAKGLAAGDKCLFQFIQGTGNVLHVQILSKGAGTSGSGPATYTGNRS